MVNYFEILNISVNAEPEIIKASYKALAKKYHPDNYSGTKNDSDKKMKLINEAYRVLSDDFLRRQHIEQLRVTTSSQNSSATVTNTQNQTQNSEKSYKESPIKFNERASPYTSYNHNSRFSFNWSSIILSIVIIVSISFCITHFGPNLLKEFLENTINQIEKLKYNWGL